MITQQPLSFCFLLIIDHPTHDMLLLCFLSQTLLCDSATMPHGKKHVQSHLNHEHRTHTEKEIHSNNHLIQHTVDSPQSEKGFEQ